MKVIATDLDRTLIPNGSAEPTRGAMEFFVRELRKHKIKLVYVTGRHKKIILEGMKKYDLPKPDLVVGDVGTKIYRFSRGRLNEVKEWNEFLEADWKGLRRKDIAEALSEISGLKEQEKEKLNEFKQSYYVSSETNRESVVRRIKKALDSKKVKYEVIYSYDVKKKRKLIDILPARGTKRGALEFIMKKLDAGREDVLFAGDSGNDLLALSSGVYGVVVKNAEDEVKKELMKIVRRKKLKDRVHIAKGGFKGMNGNYVSGIIEGAFRFGFFED